jgi:hypothetical protein
VRAASTASRRVRNHWWLFESHSLQTHRHRPAAPISERRCVMLRQGLTRISTSVKPRRRGRPGHDQDSAEVISGLLIERFEDGAERGVLVELVGVHCRRTLRAAA